MRLIKSKLGPVCFFQQAKFPWFSLRVSLTRHFVARSLDHPKPSPIAFFASAISFFHFQSPLPISHFNYCFFFFYFFFFFVFLFFFFFFFFFSFVLFLLFI